MDWFYGLKDALLLRDGSDPLYAPDEQQWSEWANVDRSAVQDQGLSVLSVDFDPVVVGPWMDLWDIDSQDDPLGGSLHNPHTARYLASPADRRDVQAYVAADNW